MNIRHSTIKAFFCSVLISWTPNSNAQLSGGCDQCVAGAVAAGSAAVTGVLTTINATLVEIGRSLQQNIEATTLGLNTINTTLVETSRIEVAQNHALAEQIETFELKAAINDKFGSVSQDHCYEVEKAVGAAGSPAIEDSVTNSVNNFIDEFRLNVRGAGQRTTTLRNNIPPDMDVGEFFSGATVATPEMIEALPTVVMALTESRSFPAPLPFEAAISDRDREYREIYRTREMNLSIAQNIITRSAQDASVPSKPVGEWVSAKLTQANIDPTRHVTGGLATKSGVIKAVGNGQFGSAGSSETAGLFGEELLKEHIKLLGRNNYLLAEQWITLNDQKLLTAISTARDIEADMNDDLIEAINR